MERNVRSKQTKIRSDTEMAELLVRTGESFILHHTDPKGQNPYWTNDHDGSGDNAAGLQLMIIRDELRETNGMAPTKWPNFITRDCGIIEETGEHATDAGRNRWSEVTRKVSHRKCIPGYQQKEASKTGGQSLCIPRLQGKGKTQRRR